jgi:DNA-directed RNA polymerase alpha subunit
MASNTSLEKAKQELSRKAHMFRQVFNTDEGKKVLAVMEQEAEPDQMFSDNPHRTSYNCGKRDMLVYIKQMLRYEDESK